MSRQLLLSGCLHFNFVFVYVFINFTIYYPLVRCSSINLYLGTLSNELNNQNSNLVTKIANISPQYDTLQLKNSAELSHKSKNYKRIMFSLKDFCPQSYLAAFEATNNVDTCFLCLTKNKM